MLGMSRVLINQRGVQMPALWGSGGISKDISLSFLFRGERGREGYRA
jgi:hypothetical protein